MPEISIIVPVYKVEEYLRECLDSILRQTFSNFELILVDDGSPDSSGVICDQYANLDERIRVIHQKNGGHSAARNAGLDIAEGKYISFIDGDDCVPDWMLEELHQVIKKYDVDMVKGRHQRFVDDIGEVDQYDANVYIMDTEQAIKNFLCEAYSSEKKINVAVWDGLYRREIFDNIRFPFGLIYEDGYVTPQILLKSNKIAIYNKIIYFYRRNPNGTMAQGITKHSLQSLSDWEFLHYLITDRFPQYGNITCKKWIYKYLEMYKYLQTHKELDNNGETLRKIRKELLKNYQCFQKNGIPKKVLRELKLFAIFPKIAELMKIRIYDIDMGNNKKLCL